MTAKPDDSKEESKESQSASTDISGCPAITPWTLGDETERWSSLNTLLSRPSTKFCPPPFDPEEENLAILQEDFRVLVVGAGGLGCELLKDLALSGFKDIELIDLDTIDISNLNRQFLFRKKDVGMPKAKVAAEFVMKRVPGCKIRWYKKPLQEFSEDFYRKFNIVIAGLDNVAARRWLNSMLCDLVTKDENGDIDPDSIIPLIDGGTEGFKGQVRLFVPMVAACFECSIGTIAPQKGFQMCTIATIPRKPEHCIAYAQKKLWMRLRSLTTADDFDMVPVSEGGDDPEGVQLDKDNIHHMSWIYNRAAERAKEYNIEGVSFNMTQQVVKNIIPAIASTNALVSAACVNEAFKVLTWCSLGLNNYFMYMGHEGTYARTFEFARNPQCAACGSDPMKYTLDPNTTFKTLKTKILNDGDLQLVQPSITTDQNKTLWVNAKVLRANYEKNLEMPLSALFASETVLRITDSKVLGRGVCKVRVVFEDGAIYMPPTDDL